MMKQWGFWLLAAALLVMPVHSVRADQDHGTSESGEGGEGGESGETELKARLSPAKGSAEYQSSTKGRSLEISVKTTLATGDMAAFTIDGWSAGTYMVGKKGQLIIKLSTKNGQAVPVIAKGSKLQITKGGVLISGGTF